MDPIKSLDAVAQMLRQRVASEAARNGRKTAASSGAPMSARNARLRPSMAGLRRRVTDALEGMDLTRPEQQKRALRVLVEHVLAWEFGEQVLNDPRFAELVNEVQQVLGKNVKALERLVDSSERG